MDLSSYLLKSKEKRKDLAQVADKYLSESVDLNANDIISGPSPQKFQVFQSELEGQLKKIFNPALELEKPGKTRLNWRKPKYSIESAYSGHSEYLNRKQIVMIPKDYLHTYNVKARPNISSLKKTANSTMPKGFSQQIERKSRKSSRNPNRDSLYLPVLSTIGTHEQRSKLYKYR